MEQTRPQPVGMKQGGYGNKTEHEYADVWCGREENAQWTGSYGIQIIPNIRRGLALGRKGLFQFCYLFEVGGSGEGKSPTEPEGEFSSGKQTQ